MRETFELYGDIPSKKNGYGYSSRTRRRFVPNDVKEALDRLGLQIPACLRNARLDHPRIDMRILYTSDKQDRDNQVQALLDILKVRGVIIDDNIAHCNSTQRTLPAVKSAYNGVLITIDSDGDADDARLYMPDRCPRCGL